ncbi:MAG: MFS transporter [Nitrososphaerales archaeon]|nr:MFS transporter [Nitrososphaerales archaeon]
MNGKGGGSYKWTVLLITSIGAFMTPLDSTIVSVSLPAIASSLSIDYATVIWVPTAYLASLTVLLLSLGRLSDMRGRKPLFVSGFVTFITASLLCSISYSGLQLIVFRAVQGVGAAFIGATSTAIVTDVFPSRERGKALGINAMSVYVGLSVGPSLGGFLTHTLGWRSIFYINVPIGVSVIALALLKLRETVTPIQKQRFDLLGASTFSFGLVSLLVALTLGEGYGWGLSIIGLFIVGGVLLVIFTLVEKKRGTGAMLDISLFSRNRLFAAANVSALLNYTSYFGVSFFTSFYLQRALDYSPLQAGIILLTMPVIMAVLAPISGWLSDRIGSRILSSLGMVLICIGLLLMSTLGLTSSSTDVVIRLFIIGFGMGLFSSPNTSAVMGSVERNRLGVASGTLATMRFVGQSMSLAIMGAVVATVASSEVLSALFIGLVPSEVEVAAEAFVEGMRRAFIASAFIATLGVFTSLVRGKGK